MGIGKPMRSVICGFAVLALLTVVSTARADVPTARFRAYLASTFGVLSPQWVACPRVQRFNGQSLCEAQFRQGTRWRWVAAAVSSTGSITGPSTRTWVRSWRTCPRRDMSSVPGTLSSNMGDCDYLMAGDVQNDVDLQLRFPGLVLVHGTNTAGFGARVEYRCVRENLTARCTNSLGDSFRYTVPAGSLPPPATHWCRQGDPPSAPRARPRVPSLRACSTASTTAPC